MTRRGELTTAEVIYDGQTDTLIYVELKAGFGPVVRLHKSICTIDPPHPDWGDTVTTTASEWVLQQKGLI